MPIATPFLIAAAVTSMASAGMGAYAAYQQGKQQKAMADYNAKIAENEAIAQQQAIESERQRLADAQRGMKAKQRMSVSSRGGLAEGTDLMSLAEQAKVMQLDQLELMRQKNLAGVRGASQAAMSRYQGQMAKTSGRWTAGTNLVGGAASATSALGQIED